MLLINLSILTVLLIAVFSTLYVSTYTNIQQIIDQEMNFFLDHANDFFREEEPVGGPPGGDIGDTRSISFLVKTDSSDVIIDTYSSFNITDDTIYQDALDLIDDSEGRIVLDDEYWAYLTVPSMFDGGVIYIFINITNQHTVLNNMILTFLMVFALSFIVVYVLSSFVTNKSISKIKEAFTKQKQFVSNASHELKTPLAIINTNVDVLSSKIKDEETNKWLDYIKFETERMNKLTKDLLYLTKVSEQKAYEIVKERLNLSEITESILLSFEALAYEKNINIEYDIAKEVYTEFSRDQYDQVVHILLDNAIKYSPENGSINVELKSSSNHISICVRNAGEGIKEEDIKNIFDRFYMGDKSRSMHPNSYGLGLSIAKSIIDNHGGKIYCESVLNEHTAFYIKLKIKSVQ